jgi:hypothetical protein
MDDSAMICHQTDAQISGCPDGPATDPLASENNIDVRIPVRTTSKSDAPHETPVGSGIMLTKIHESPLSVIGSQVRLHIVLAHVEHLLPTNPQAYFRRIPPCIRC